MPKRPPFPIPLQFCGQDQTAALHWDSLPGERKHPSLSNISDNGISRHRAAAFGQMNHQACLSFHQNSIIFTFLSGWLIFSFSSVCAVFDETGLAVSVSR